MNIHTALDELSYLSRETSGGSFTIQHMKESGKWKVVFLNCAMHSKERLKETEFEQAIQDAIDWIRVQRKPIDVPTEKYTLFNR